jgi:glycosyltransferase involved in cell wall biosynthesis
MHQDNFELIKKMSIASDAVIINQCNYNSLKYIDVDNYKIKWINSKERGLSRSRNMAIENADADICVLADDDLVYISGYEKIILEQFKLNPDYDILTFQVQGIERKFKDYFPKPRNLNYLTSMKVSSVKIAFRRSSIINAGIKFNEMFGSGVKYF